MRERLFRGLSVAPRGAAEISGKFQIARGIPIRVMIEGSSWTALRLDLAETRRRKIALAPARAAAYSWRSWWWSLAERFARAGENPESERVPPGLPPVVIGGFWRSGTTLLHELLSSDPSF